MIDGRDVTNERLTLNNNQNTHDHNGIESGGEDCGLDDDDDDDEKGGVALYSWMTRVHSTSKFF